jgi:hypothetical protein
MLVMDEDDDMPEEWLAQVFEVAPLKSLKEDMLYDGWLKFTSLRLRPLIPNLY